MVTITRYPHPVWVVTIPSADAQTFTSERQAESYAEIRSIVLDLPVTRKVA